MFCSKKQDLFILSETERRKVLCPKLNRYTRYMWQTNVLGEDTWRVVYLAKSALLHTRKISFS